MLIPNSEFRMVSSLWAHFAMFAIFEEDKKAIDAVLRELLAVPVEAAPEQARAEAGAPDGAKRWYRDRPALHGCRRLGTPSVAPSLQERGWRRAVLCRAGVVNS